MASEVLLPTSPDEAVEAFGDGSGITVFAGGTVVMPEVTYGRLEPERVLLLKDAGLAGVVHGGGVVTIGAMTPLSALDPGDEPLATAARHVGDPEIRAQATVGGNICVTAGEEAPRGDLQAPLIVLGARVRSAGADGTRSEPIEDFLRGDGSGRLVLDVTYDDVPRQTGYAVARRPHAHHYTILAVACSRTSDETRVAVTGGGPHALRCSAVEAALSGGAPPEEASRAVLADVQLRDDAVASAWYREQVLPTLVAQALAQLGEGNR